MSTTHPAQDLYQPSVVGVGELGDEIPTGNRPGTAPEPVAVRRPSGQPHPLNGQVSRTPLFQAQHDARYGRQELIRRYEEVTGASLIVVIDQIFSNSPTFLEELLLGCEPHRPLHVLLASPGGDGETALRLVRSMQSRCSELTFIIPDMAKSAATLMCLGADNIIMGPAGGLGPVDPQFQAGEKALASAKEIVAAVDEVEKRISKRPETLPLFTHLLTGVNMLMVEQARSALSRTGALVEEVLGSKRGRSSADIAALKQSLQAPLIDEPTSHSAVFSVADVQRYGLPAVAADVNSAAWKLLWTLWTRYYVLGCWPAGTTAIYESGHASQLQ
jgi:hypothetical protein